MLEVISVYVPNGQVCNEEELTQLYISYSNSINICGDFNARHKGWEENCVHSNRSGRAVADLLEKENNLMLATPPYLGTRQCPRLLKSTTIDLAIMSPHLAASEITKGPCISSNPFPIHIKIKAKPTQFCTRPPSWNFNGVDWRAWNASVKKP